MLLEIAIVILATLMNNQNIVFILVSIYLLEIPIIQLIIVL